MLPGMTRGARILSTVISFILISLLLHACSDDLLPPGGQEPTETPWPAAALIHSTECKEDMLAAASDAPLVQDCIWWEWDGADTLTLVHVNAALNCCPGTITSIIEPEFHVVSEDDPDGSHAELIGFAITETEGDDAIMCRCLCLYDLTYKIAGVTGGSLEITFIEQYIEEGDKALSCWIDVDTEPVGSHCLHRDTYPWSMGYSGDDPAGTIDDYSGCKTVTGTDDYPWPLSPDSQCVVVDCFPAADMIRIRHINTAYNCCVDALDAEFTFEEDLITITGREHPEGGWCDCICLYDVSYTIYNLDPGVYTIRFVDPYQPGGHEVLEITVDTSIQGQAYECVYRGIWPWGTLTDEERDKAKLEEMYDGIVEYIGTPYCSGAGDCRYIGIGSKPCGGPWHYLVYSATTLDEAYLMSLAAELAAFEDYMNMKYGYASTCDVPPIPRLECRDGICRATYE